MLHICSFLRKTTVRGIKWSLKIFKCSQNLALAQFPHKVSLDGCSVAHVLKSFAVACMLGFVIAQNFVNQALIVGFLGQKYMYPFKVLYWRYKRDLILFI